MSLETQALQITRWHLSTRSQWLRNVGRTRFRNVIVDLKGAFPAGFESGPCQTIWIDA